MKTFIIAEAGVNHNGDIKIAKKLIDIATDAGADAVKFQTFKAERLVTKTASKAEYQTENIGTDESQFEMLKKLELSLPEHRELFAYCRDKGIVFMSTPFDEESADMLEDLGMEIFKIPSGEITNLPFLAHVARKKKRMIVSTGMSYLGEIETAVRAIEECGNKDLVLLHCVSNYPANPADTNLRAMQILDKAFMVPVGYSDHTQGTEIAIAAVALGACVIEKHFTLDRSLLGPDHQASLEPKELAALVRGIRIVEKALGSGRKAPANNEVNTAAVIRKSLVAARDIPAGTILTKDMIAVKRPGTGIAPSFLSEIIGMKVRKLLKTDDVFSWEYFNG